jgi:hypothetical protein
MGKERNKKEKEEKHTCIYLKKKNTKYTLLHQILL